MVLFKDLSKSVSGIISKGFVHDSPLEVEHAWKYYGKGSLGVKGSSVLKDTADLTKWGLKTDYTHELKGVKTVVKVGTGLAIETEVGGLAPGLKLVNTSERKSSDGPWTSTVITSQPSTCTPPFLGKCGIPRQWSSEGGSRPPKPSAFAQEPPSHC